MTLWKGVKKLFERMVGKPSSSQPVKIQVVNSVCCGHFHMLDVYDLPQSFIWLHCTISWWYLSLRKEKQIKLDIFHSQLNQLIIEWRALKAKLIGKAQKTELGNIH